MAGEVPERADVVIVGGGVIGARVAYHPARLLERRKLTSGTTWHSAGQVRRLRPSRNLTGIIRCSTELYAGLEADEPILAADEIVRQVTSAAFGHTVGRRFTIDVGGRPCAATAHLGPALGPGRGARAGGAGLERAA